MIKHIFKCTYNQGLPKQIYKFALLGQIDIKYVTMSELFNIVQPWKTSEELSNKDVALDNILNCASKVLNETSKIENLQNEIDDFENKYHPRTKKYVRRIKESELS